MNNVTIGYRNVGGFEVNIFTFLDRSKCRWLENRLQFRSRSANTKSKSKSLCLVWRCNLDTQKSRDIRRKQFGSRVNLRSLLLNKWMVCSVNWERMVAIRLLKSCLDLLMWSKSFGAHLTTMQMIQRGRFGGDLFDWRELTQCDAVLFVIICICHCKVFFVIISIIHWFNGGRCW